MDLNLRRSLRDFSTMRHVTLESPSSPYAEGSCLVKFGNTHVMCTASVEETVPPFLRKTGKGWVTAEYGMLPRSTGSRIQREASKGKQDGRTQEIQRLIGRSLRSIINTDLLGERQVIVDCDVIQADGGTRTAAITGGYVALHMAVEWMSKRKMLRSWPIKNQVAAISCGIVKGNIMLDLEYAEDSEADVDANFVMSSDGAIIEIQGCAEKVPFSKSQLDEMYILAQQSMEKLFTLQKTALSSYRLEK